MSPYILAIDTAGHACSVALIDHKTTAIFQETQWMSRGHAAALPPLIEKALQLLDPHDIGAVIVTRGPGGFTGMRAGLAFARAFALARSIPLYAIDCFTALRLQVGLKVPCLIDSRRGDFFYDAPTAAILSLPALENAEIGLLPQEKIHLISQAPAGSIWQTRSQQDLPHSKPEKPGWIEPDPVKLAAYGLELSLAKGIIDPQNLTPLYVRAPTLG